jgi:hypothetical protein
VSRAASKPPPVTASVAARPLPASAVATKSSRHWLLQWMPLVVILVAQATLSARLLSAYSASSDESLYIYSGHQLIYELWHGGGSPYYEEWLSGAPVLYPLLAALADHLVRQQPFAS